MKCQNSLIFVTTALSFEYDIFQGLLGRNREDLMGVLEEDLPRHTIHSVPVYGQDKYLVLEDVDVKSVSDLMLSSPEAPPSHRYGHQLDLVFPFY